MFIIAVIERIKAISVNPRLSNNTFYCEIIARPQEMLMQNINQTEM